MRPLLLCALYCLASTYALALPVSPRTLRPEITSADVTFAKTDGRGIGLTPIIASNSLLVSFNDKKKNSTNGTQQRNDRINPLQATVQEDNHENRGKRESLFESQKDTKIKKYLNSILQSNAPHSPEPYPSNPIRRPKLLSKKPIQTHSHHKGIFTKYRSTLLGSSKDSEHQDSPESTVLGILRYNPSGNNEDVKNVALTKTTAYNITKLAGSSPKSNFLLEKKENLTVEMSLLDSQEKETKYSNTLSSQLQKVFGPDIFYDESASEEDIEGNTQEENQKEYRNAQYKGVDEIYPPDSSTPEITLKELQDLIENSILEKAYKESSSASPIQGEKKESEDLLAQPNAVNEIYPPDSLTPEITLKELQDLIENSILEKAYKESSSASPVPGDKKESKDILSQSNRANEIYPPDSPIPEITVTELQDLIEETILEKAYKESSSASPVQISDDTIKLPNTDSIEVKHSDSNYYNQQTEEDRNREEIPNFSNHETTLRQDLSAENPKSKESIESSTKCTATTSSILENISNPSVDKIPLTIKHGPSMVLGSLYDVVTVEGLASSPSEANDISESYNTISSQERELKSNTEEATSQNDELETEPISTTLNPTEDVWEQTSTTQLTGRLNIDEDESGNKEEDNTEDRKYPLSTSGMDSLTEEVSNKNIVSTKKSVSNGYDDITTSNYITNHKNTLSNNRINKGVLNDRETVTGKYQSLKNKSKAFNTKEEDSKPLQSGVSLDQNESDYEDEEVSVFHRHPQSILGLDPQTEEATTETIGDETESSYYSEDTSEDFDVVTGEYTNIDPSMIKPNGFRIPLERNNTDRQRSTLDNEIERVGGTHPHVVELFGGRHPEKGQKVIDTAETTTAKTGFVREDSNITTEEATKEPLTELCFSLVNEKEITLWDLLSGKLYVENEGKRTLLKLKDNAMKRCHSGTVKCKLPVSFVKTNEPAKEANSLEGVDETDISQSSKVSKRHIIIENENVGNERKEVEMTDHSSTEQILSNKDEKEIFGLRGATNNKQVLLTDLMLMLLTNETSPNNNVKICTPTSSQSSEEAVQPGLKVKDVHPITDSLKSPPQNLNLHTFLKRVVEEGKTQDAETPNSTPSGVSEEEESSGKRFKRSLGQQHGRGDEKETVCGCRGVVRAEGKSSGKRFKRTIAKGKDGGCGCGSMLGRALPPIPNYDHFVGKRLNILTNIAHAIKDWAVNRTY